MSNKAIAVLLLLLALLPWYPASADMVLKPSGENAYPLRTKALKAFWLSERVLAGFFETTNLGTAQGRRVDPGCPGNLHDRHALICGDRILSDRSPQSVVWKRDAPLSLGL